MPLAISGRASFVVAAALGGSDQLFPLARTLQNAYAASPDFTQAAAHSRRQKSDCRMVWVSSHTKTGIQLRIVATRK